MSPTPTGRALQPERAWTSEMAGSDASELEFSLPWFITYKFLNSLFLGVSIGSVFTLYAPLSPATFSAGGIGLAVATMLIATQYQRIFNRFWFLRISVLTELIIFVGVLAVLSLKSGHLLALIIYLGYQLAFTFGSYLVRYETLLISTETDLKSLDIAKQSAYLVGMGLAWVFYRLIEHFGEIMDADQQVYLIYYPLLLIELTVLGALIKSFPKSDKSC